MMNNFNLDRDYSLDVSIAINTVLRSEKWINGPQLAQFERSWAIWNGMPYAVGVGCGTDALRLALLAMGVKPGDTVISPAFNAAYAAQAVRSIGAKNAYVDIIPGTMLIDPADLRAHRQARAIIPVHLFGQMANMPAVEDAARQHGLAVIEDAAQAHGARFEGRGPGTISDAACYSHYPTKNLGCIGEGGSVTTCHQAVADYIRLARDAGRTDRYIHQIDGINSMLDEIQAAVLNVRLAHLVEQNDKRRKLALRYKQSLVGCGDLRWQETHEEAWHVYHLFVVRTEARELLMDFLKNEDIPALSHYPCTIPQQPFARAEALAQGRFPHSEAAAAEVLSLPLWPGMTEAEQDRVIEAVRRFYGA